MALNLLLFLPAVVGTWLVLGGRGLPARAAATIAVLTSVGTLLLTVLAVVDRPAVDRSWLPAFDIRWHLLVDGLSAPLLLLTAVVGLLVCVHGLRHPPEGGAPGLWFGLVLLVLAGALATFLAADAVLFFVAFEVVLVPMWLIIGRFGDPHDAALRREASLRFLLFTALGSTLMLVGILWLVVRSGTADLTRMPSAVAGLDHGTQVLGAALLTAGLAVKVPLWPVHTWLPPAHTTAPTGGSVLLAAVLLKMGTYGLARLPVATVPEGWSTIAPVVAVLGAVGIVWGGLVCLVERDLKRLIAYSSVAHMGFVAVGLASGTQVGLQAALFANVAHGVISALLFFVVGGLKERWGQVDLDRIPVALREGSPRLGLALVLGLAASLGLPGLAGFWGEFLAVVGSYRAYTDGDRVPGLYLAVTVAAAVGAALASAYALRVARLVWVGPEARAEDATGDTDPVETGVLGALGVAIVVLGVVPGWLLAVTWPAVEAVIAR